MAIYEYQGTSYDIATDDPAEAKNKILSHLSNTQDQSTTLQKAGQGAASLADTALNTITGGLDWAAYPLARAYYGTVGGMAPEAAATRAQQETTSPKNIIGRAFGVENTPAYQNELSRQATGAIGQGVGGLAHAWSQGTGLPQQDIENMIGSGMMAAGPAVPRVAQGVSNAAGFVKNVGKGAFINEPGTALLHIGDTVFTPEGVRLYENGSITKQQLESQYSVPKEQLFNNWKDRLALRVAGNQVPAAGRLGQAMGEQLAQQVTDPTKLLTNLGTEFVTGVPLGGITKPAQAAAFVRLHNKYDFSPTFLEKYRNDTGANPPSPPPGGTGGPTPPAGPSAPVAPSTPQLGYNPNPGQTPMPMGGPPRAVNIEGQRSVLPYQINTANSQPTGPVRPGSLNPDAGLTPPIGTTAPATAPPEQAGANFIATQEKKLGTPSPTQSMLADPEKAARAKAILDSIRARDVKKSPEVAAPVAPATETAPATAETPVAPEGFTPPANWTNNPAYRAPKSTETGLAGLQARLKQISPDELAAQQAETEALLAKRAERSAKMQPAIQATKEFKKNLNDNVRAGIGSKNKNIIVNKNILAETLPDKDINWSEMPNLQGKSVAEARLAVKDFMKQQRKTAPGKSNPDVMSMMTTEPDYGAKEIQHGTFDNPGDYETAQQIKSYGELANKPYRIHYTDPEGNIHHEVSNPNSSYHSHAIEHTNGDSSMKTITNEGIDESHMINGQWKHGPKSKE